MGQKYYLHDTTRGYVGNSMVWWRKGHHGYTCNIDEAHEFDASELPQYLQAGDLVAYPVEHIRGIAEPHVDMQKLDLGTSTIPEGSFLRNLRNEAAGTVGMPGLRELIGNTNMACLEQRIDEAEQCLPKGDAE